VIAALIDMNRICLLQSLDDVKILWSSYVPDGEDIQYFGIFADCSAWFL
jgi:hypothetical protein